MNAEDIKFEATHKTTGNVYHFALDDLGIDGSLEGGCYAMFESDEGKNIPYFDLDEYDIEVVK